MAITQFGFSDFERFKIQRFGLAIVALRVVQSCQIIETDGGVGMVIAQFPLS